MSARTRPFSSASRSLVIARKAAVFAAAGIPTVYHGPVGSGAHADVEYMEVAELVRATEVYVALLRRLF